jgi:hypothetical protein
MGPFWAFWDGSQIHPIRTTSQLTMATTDLSDSRQTEVLVVAWVMTGAAIFTVGVKLFARAKIVRVVGWDDFFIFLSLVDLHPFNVVTSLDLCRLTFAGLEHCCFFFRTLWCCSRVRPAHCSSCRRVWRRPPLHSCKGPNAWVSYVYAHDARILVTNTTAAFNIGMCALHVRQYRRLIHLS